MNVLVTGGAGYVGSHVAKALGRCGYRPIIYDNLSTGHRWAVGSTVLVEADLADSKTLARTLKEQQITAVFHLAADAYVHESVAAPRRYFQNNVVNSLSLVHAMLDHGVKHIVYSSSCATYGFPETVPISEEHHQRPVSPYGESKLFIERALHWYGRAYDLRWVALRYFNAAGASEEIGECREHEVRLIPLAIRAALGMSVLSLSGTDYPTKDGTAVRDYVHVEDLASAHVLAFEYLLKDGESRAFNLGTETGYSVREVVSMVEQVSGRTVQHRAAERRPGDPSTLIANSKAAREVLGWKPERSSLRRIVESAWAWQSKLSSQKTRVEEQ